MLLKDQDLLQTVSCSFRQEKMGVGGGAVETSIEVGLLVPPDVLDDAWGCFSCAFPTLGRCCIR